MGYLVFHSFDALDHFEVGEIEFNAYITDEDGQVGTIEVELELMETSEYEELILGLESKYDDKTSTTTETEETTTETEETTTDENGCGDNEEYNESTKECEAIITVEETADTGDGTTGKGEG